MAYKILKAIHISNPEQPSQIVVEYAGIEAASDFIEVGCGSTDFRVRVHSNKTYNGSNQIIAEFVEIDGGRGEGIEHYQLGYRKQGDSGITPGTWDSQTITAKDAGTYYIYKKLETNEDYCVPTGFIQVPGSITINKATPIISGGGILPDQDYNSNSHEITLTVEAPGTVHFPTSITAESARGQVEWSCSDNGTLTIPGGTRGPYTYTLTATVSVDESDNYVSGSKELTWTVHINRKPPIEIPDEHEYAVSDYEHPDYVRLDDDVSFQILRTNPKLTTNTKLLYDGKDMYMEAYHAAPILSTMDYKNHKVYSTGLFNKDLRKFLLNTDMAAYTVGQDVRNTIIPDNFDNQFENMYWCGIESINSDVYPQEMGCIAPLYLRKKKPNYFVIFKVDTPANTNLVGEKDNTYDFKEDILKTARIVKAFDLREGTPIGNYIKRYVEQKNFEYDKSIYVNFSSNEIYYYGIDKSSGVLTQKVENFEQQLLNNDNTIMKMDDWITSGFERNNLIFPYIINFEFLFDDKETEEYKFARYFGMYCNDIDLYDVDVTNMANGENKSTDINVDWRNGYFEMSENSFYYIKDKYKNIFTIKDYVVPGCFNSPSRLNLNDFTGFELDSVSTYAERISGRGRSIMILEVYNSFRNTDFIQIRNIRFSPSSSIDINPGEFKKNGNNYRFCNKGELKDIAKALAGAINDYSEDEFKWIRAYNIDNKIVIESVYSGSNLNYLFNVDGNNIYQSIKKITDGFIGGTDVDGCMFKVYTEDRNIFEESHSRYLRCGMGKDSAKILSFLPYMHDREIDDTYSLITTDNNGPYVIVSGTDQVEILDKFYAKIGVLSFFPVKDFDFDTVSSAYGNGDMMKKELDTVNKDIELEYYNDDRTKKDTVFHIIDIPYGRFFYHNGNSIDAEYEYFFENIIPELCTVNKTVPYIAKWGYIDDSKDSCENVYRLNTSKIFETCNFSANTYSRNGDILEYTHSMPYYINNFYCNDFNEDNYKNEYQYIPVSSEMWKLSTGKKTIEGGREINPTKSEENVLDTWIDYFLSEDENNFEKIFGDTSRSPLKNKRFNKKYSRFLLGNKVNRSSTLFRGVKFEIEELDNGKETHTGKFNNYKFSFIYIPVWNIENNKYTVHFIKNDKFKFIVGLVLFDVKTDLNYREFNKAFVYAGSMSYIEDNGEDEQENTQQNG